MRKGKTRKDRPDEYEKAINSIGRVYYRPKKKDNPIKEESRLKNILFDKSLYNQEEMRDLIMMDFRDGLGGEVKTTLMKEKVDGKFKSILKEVVSLPTLGQLDIDYLSQLPFEQYDTFVNQLYELKENISEKNKELNIRKKNDKKFLNELREQGHHVKVGFNVVVGTTKNFYPNTNEFSDGSYKVGEPLSLNKQYELKQFLVLTKPIQESLGITLNFEKSLVANLKKMTDQGIFKEYLHVVDDDGTVVMRATAQHLHDANEIFKMGKENLSKLYGTLPQELSFLNGDLPIPQNPLEETVYGMYLAEKKQEYETLRDEIATANRTGDTKTIQQENDPVLLSDKLTAWENTESQESYVAEAFLSNPNLSREGVIRVKTRMQSQFPWQYTDELKRLVAKRLSI